HTRFSRDWSSDVCSSDLIVAALPEATGAIISAVKDLLPVLLQTVTELFSQVLQTLLSLLPELIPAAVDAVMTIAGTLIDNLPLRSEERRVGKEGGSRRGR